MTDTDRCINDLRRMVEIIRAGVVIPERLEGRGKSEMQWSTPSLGFRTILSFDTLGRGYKLHLISSANSFREDIRFVSAELGELVAKRYLTPAEIAQDLASLIEERDGR